VAQLGLYCSNEIADFKNESFSPIGVVYRRWVVLVAVVFSSPEVLVSPRLGRSYMGRRIFQCTCPKLQKESACAHTRRIVEV
jgi:hypothetical protein